MSTQQQHHLPLSPFNYSSNRVLLKTLLHHAHSDDALALVGQRVLVGGWVKSSKQVKKPSTSSSSTSSSSLPLIMMKNNDGFDETRNKDVSCVEILQSRVPFVRSIFHVFGGKSYYASRKKVEHQHPLKDIIPQPSTLYLLLTDGSCVSTLQVVIDSSVAQPSKVLATGTCILVEGILGKPSSEGKHFIELKADKVLHIGTVDTDNYLLSRKRIPLDMIRDYSHFRPRTTTVATIMRIRNVLSFAAHSFFDDHAFIEVHVPTITTIDSEGFSNLFKVTTLDRKAEKEKVHTIYETEGVSLDVVKEAAKEKSNQVENLKRSESNREALAAAIQDLRKTNELVLNLEAREKKTIAASLKDEKVDSSKDFFSCQTYLTVSGRLHLESYACALGNVYSFGPRFQADKTDSAKHAAEMWNVEAEMAFSQLKDSMSCANDFVKYLCKRVLENCSEDLKFVAKRIDNTCIDRLQQIVSVSPEMLSYTEAIDVLRKVEAEKFETNFEWGIELTTEHLSYLADTVYNKPVMIYNYPKEVRPFYVRLNDDGKTVAAFDLIVPKVGTMISGSENEERLNIITSRIKELGLAREKYEWYIDLRRNGTVKHSGFTLKFDIMVLFTTGLSNVRDVIPFPTSYGKANH